MSAIQKPMKLVTENAEYELVLIDTEYIVHAPTEQMLKDFEHVKYGLSETSQMFKAVVIDGKFYGLKQML